MNKFTIYFFVVVFALVGLGDLTLFAQSSVTHNNLKQFTTPYFHRYGKVVDRKIGTPPVNNADHSIFKTLGGGVSESWVARYNGPGDFDDIAYYITLDDSGNSYVVGQTTNASFNSDFVTIKYNSAGNEVWSKTYDGPGGGEDAIPGVVLDQSGNVYVTGVSLGSGTGNDIATIKYNSSGVEQWVVRYNSHVNLDDKPVMIAIDNSANIYVTGFTQTTNNGLDFITIKYNSSGAEQWVATYNGTGNADDIGTDIICDNSGNVYVTGQAFNTGTGYDYTTIKYDESGNELWVATYNGPDNSDDMANYIVVDASGNVYVAGASNTNPDFATIKYDNSGNELWVARYDSDNNLDAVEDLAVDNAGNVYVTGPSFSLATNYDYVTIKYNSSGVEQWVSSYNSPDNNGDVAYALALDDLGNVYVTGTSFVPSIGNDFATVKYDASGTEQWVARYDGPLNSDDEVFAIAVDNNRNVYVAGFSLAGATNFDYDITTIKYEQEPLPVELTSFTADVSEGKVILNWSTATETNNQGFEVQRKIISANSQSDWSTIGFKEGVGTTTEKHEYSYVDNLSGIESASLQYRLKQVDFDGSYEYSDAVEIQIAQPNGFNLSQNYPNPFNPTTKISFNLAAESNVTLKVFDVLGREIRTLVNDKLTVGSYNIDFDATGMNSGVYFYKIEAAGIDGSNYSSVKKMILTK